MHYRNGREAKNGDKIVHLSYADGRIEAVGVLYDAVPGNDHCNGMMAPLFGGFPRGACLCDCLHLDDFAALIVAAGLDKRPAGK